MPFPFQCYIHLLQGIDFVQVKNCLVAWQRPHHHLAVSGRGGKKAPVEFWAIPQVQPRHLPVGQAGWLLAMKEKVAETRPSEVRETQAFATEKPALHILDPEGLKVLTAPAFHPTGKPKGRQFSYLLCPNSSRKHPR